MLSGWSFPIPELWFASRDQPFAKTQLLRRENGRII